MEPDAHRPSLAARLARSLALMWLVSVASFAMLHAMPGDPVVITLSVQNVPVTPDTVAALRAEWGLDRPLIEQYWRWLADFLSGDWGVSFRTAQPVLEEFARRLPVSMVLGFGGLGLAVAVAIPLGFAAASRPGGGADRAARAITVLTQAVPSFWLGLVAIWLFAVELGVLRAFTGPLVERLVLPVGMVALYSLGTLTRVYRTELLAAAEAPMFQTALAKGLSRPQALWRHAHRRALFGLVASLTPEFGWVIGGTAVTEVVFGLPGISQFLVESIGVRDYLVLQAYIFVIALWMLAVSALAAVAGRVLDPRVRA